MLYFYLTMALEIIFVVHAIRTGRNLFWIFIIIFFPLIGIVAYLIVEILPELGSSRASRNTQRLVSRALNPGGSIRSASQQLAVADTVENSVQLGNEYLERSRFADAREVFARCLKGVHADDPVILLGLARAQFGLEEYTEARQTLDALFDAHPKERLPHERLLFARTLEQLGDTDRAQREYEDLCTYYPGPEPECRLGLILKAKGEVERARELFGEIVKESKIAGRHYNRLHREWVSLAKKEAVG